MSTPINTGDVAKYLLENSIGDVTSWLDPARIAKLVLGMLLIFVAVFALLFSPVEQAVTSTLSFKKKVGL